eukprot:s1297_g3.t1
MFHPFFLSGVAKAKAKAKSLQAQTTAWKKLSLGNDDKSGEEGEEEEIKEDDEIVEPGQDKRGEKRSYNKARKFQRMLKQGLIPDEIAAMYNDAHVKQKQQRLFRTELVNRLFQKTKAGEWVLCHDSPEFLSWKKNSDQSWASQSTEGVPYSVMLWGTFHGSKEGFDAATAAGDIFESNGMWHHQKVQAGRTKTTEDIMQLQSGKVKLDTDQFAAFSSFLSSRDWSKYGQQMDLEDNSQKKMQLQRGKSQLALEYDQSFHKQPSAEPSASASAPSKVVKLPWKSLEKHVIEAKSANERLQRDCNRLVVKVRGAGGELEEEMQGVVEKLQDNLHQLSQCQMWNKVPNSNGNEKAAVEIFFKKVADQTEEINEGMEKVKGCLENERVSVLTAQGIRSLDTSTRHVQQVEATDCAFAAVANHGVVAWGLPHSGGDCRKIQKQDAAVSVTGFVQSCKHVRRLTDWQKDGWFFSTDGRKLCHVGARKIAAPALEEQASEFETAREALEEFLAPGLRSHSYFPSPMDWRALSIYQLVTDRFADGDPRNNEALYGGFDVRDMTFRHGGDFVGLQGKLDYIKGLGCQAIWISPIFQNGFNFYHQYAQHDFTLLDRRLGTLEELRALTQAAHDRGMYILVDVVMNHMGNEFFFEGHSSDTAPFRFHETGGRREYRLIPRRSSRELHDTPAGKQPYMDFWYNNTWVSEAQYASPFYGQYGEAAWDKGRGTYEGSDFHHNGDLQNYADPWEINVAKIYGTMDDLRLENERVQEKYLAMTQALIASVDVDGFRVDTPMQVPLPFYKQWAPAIRRYAKTLGKEQFGIFGEFYVTTERYATMTGRGRDNTMYGQEQFIPGEATLKGGIVYPYYWYTFTALVYKRPEFVSGFALAYREENRMIDTFDPSSNRSEYAQWIFCNNHDNWRLQSLTGKEELKMCLAVITFWPGLPLHYAGDEQEIDTPGSALDGWAREELSVSLAWSAVQTSPEGNRAERDNFDMTSSNYRYISRLNALRRAYFGSFGRAQCDEVKTPMPELQDLLIFWRGCSAEGLVLVAANFNTEEARSAAFYSPWSEGTKLVDARTDDGREVTVQQSGFVSFDLRALEVVILVPGPLKLLPPMVAQTWPKHGEVLKAAGAERLQLRIRFDGPMTSDVAQHVFLDDRDADFSCTDESCQEVAAEVALKEGFHEVTVKGAWSADQQQMFATFSSTFMVLGSDDSIVGNPRRHEQPGLICSFQRLCHQAVGASYMRTNRRPIQNVQIRGQWSEWMPYENVSDWKVYPGIAVLVQYHAGTSSSYIVGDCVRGDGSRCYVSWHPEMFLRADFNGWGLIKDGSMARVNHFTWASNVTLNRFSRAKFAPQQGWKKSYGVHPRRPLLYAMPTFDPRYTNFEYQPLISGTDATRKWMVERHWWSREESLASGAEFATELWIGYECTAEEPRCPVPSQDANKWRCYSFSSSQDINWCRNIGTDDCWEYAENDWSSSMSDCAGCSCCRRAAAPELDGPRNTCCVLFNDLTLNYTVTSDLSRCAPVNIQELPEDQRIKDQVVSAVSSQPVECASDLPEEPEEISWSEELKVGASLNDTIHWSRARLRRAEEEFQKLEYARLASPVSWHNEVVYSLMVDRFANGDLSNDQSNIPSYQQQELNVGEPWSVYKWRHGGDLLGVMSRLSYFHHLGVTVVALSPVFLNSKGEYHGFDISDISKIDPGFGDAKLLRTLVHEAHQLGIRIVLDLQVNHLSGDLHYRQSHNNGVDQVSSCVKSFEEVYRNSSGRPHAKRSHQRTLVLDQMPRYLQHQEFFARCGPRDMYRPHQNSYFNEPHDSEEYEATGGCSLWMGQPIRKGSCSKFLWAQTKHLRARQPHHIPIIMATVNQEEHVAPRVNAFRNFLAQICEQVTASLCAEFEREVIQMSEDIVMYRGELAKCADLLAYQLGKEKQYHNMLENIAGNTTTLIGKSAEVGQKHAATEPLREQMQQIMDQLFHTHKEAQMGHSSLHDDHRNLVESHLLTSAQLQNQAEAVQAELDSILRVLSPLARRAWRADRGRIRNHRCRREVPTASRQGTLALRGNRKWRQVHRCRRCPATGSEVPRHQVSVFQAAFKIANSPDVQMGLDPISQKCGIQSNLTQSTRPRKLP